MSEFNDASASSRDILIEASGHINYLRTLLREFLFLPKDHPWLPGINEQIEALPVAERDATIAALQKRIDDYERADTSQQPYEKGWQDGRNDAWQAYQAEVERYKEAIHAMLGWLESDANTSRAIEIGRHVLKPASVPKAARDLLEPPSGETTHHEYCYSINVNAEGIVKPCNCQSGETSAVPLMHEHDWCPLSFSSSKEICSGCEEIRPRPINKAASGETSAQEQKL